MKTSIQRRALEMASFQMLDRLDALKTEGVLALAARRAWGSFSHAIESGASIAQCWELFAAAEEGIVGEETRNRRIKDRDVALLRLMGGGS